MKAYVNAYVFGRSGVGEQLQLALLTWIESAKDREIVVYSTYSEDALFAASYWLERSGIPFETREGHIPGSVLPHDEGSVVLVADPNAAFGEVLQSGGNLFMRTSRFVELMSSEADIDFECTGCGKFYSTLPFLETGREILCTDCAPQMSLFSEEIV